MRKLHLTHFSGMRYIDFLICYFYITDRKSIDTMPGVVV